MTPLSGADVSVGERRYVRPFRWLRRLVTRPAPLELFADDNSIGGIRRRVHRLPDKAVLYTAVDGAEDPSVLFHWPTPLTARELIELCTPFARTGRMPGDVQVVVFSDDLDGGVLRLDLDAYLSRASELDSIAHAVRFNVAGGAGRFSVVWAPARHPSDRVRGEVDAVFGRTPDMMVDMISQSSPDYLNLDLVNALIGEGRALERVPA